MAQKIGHKSCQTNFDQRSSDFGSFLVIYYCIGYYCIYGTFTLKECKNLSKILWKLYWLNNFWNYAAHYMQSSLCENQIDLLFLRVTSNLLHYLHLLWLFPNKSISKNYTASVKVSFIKLKAFQFDSIVTNS